MCKELREAPYDSTIHLLYIFFGGRFPLSYYGVMWCGASVTTYINFLKRDG
nr:MAG TPA: hypothetical protein [Caudoviricetes sp.]